MTLDEDEAWRRTSAGAVMPQGNKFATVEARVDQIDSDQVKL